MTPKRLEEVSLNSWPALQQMFFDGWVLRFANGHTKRANSVNPLFGSTLDVSQKVATCERIYREKGLRCVFRLSPFSLPSHLDEVLEQRNYELIDQTLVLHRDLSDYTRKAEGRARGQNEGVGASTSHLQSHTVDEWLEIFCELTDSSLESHQTHRAMLAAIASKPLFVSLLNDAGRPVACAVGVLENEYFGLFNMVTSPKYRKQGHGTQLLSGMLEWARQHGAGHAYLQVVSYNRPARRLYAKLGYKQIYRYWYRVLENKEAS